MAVGVNVIVPNEGDVAPSARCVAAIRAVHGPIQGVQDVIRALWQGVDVLVRGQAYDLLLNGPILDANVDQVAHHKAQRLPGAQELLRSQLLGQLAAATSTVINERLYLVDLTVGI